jgi:hypothetical protein
VSRAAPTPLPTLLLTMEQAAAACQVNLHVVEEWSHRAGFPVIRESRVVRIPLEQLQQWLAAEAIATNARPAATKELVRLPIRGGRRSPSGSSA